MKRGSRHIALANPPVGAPANPPRDQGEILGIPVEYHANHAGVADAHGVFTKKIIVGPAWIRMDYRMQRAILLHEAAHCKAGHLQQRLLLLAAIFVPPLVMLPWSLLAVIAACGAIYACWEWLGRQQEKDADAFAVDEGYGLEMARFLKMMQPEMPRIFYPDFEARMKNIEQRIKARSE